MRVFDNCFLVLVLLLLIGIFDCDLGRAFWQSDTSIHSILVVRYHCAKRLDSVEKSPQINLEKDISYGGSGRAAFQHKVLILAGRKLMMKPGVSQLEEISNSNTDNNHSMKKRIHGITRKGSRSMKHLKKKGHQRDIDEGVGAFTEDYRVPRPHPPRNN